MKMSEIPNYKHFALIEFDQYSIYHAATEGDERSRTNPGHGYPAEPGYTETVDTSRYFVIATMAELEAELTKRQRFSSASSKKNFRVLEVNPLSFDTKVSVRVGGFTETGI